MVLVEGAQLRVEIWSCSHAWGTIMALACGRLATTEVQQLQGLVEACGIGAAGGADRQRTADVA